MVGVQPYRYSATGQLSGGMSTPTNQLTTPSSAIANTSGVQQAIQGLNPGLVQQPVQPAITLASGAVPFMDDGGTVPDQTASTGDQPSYWNAGGQQKQNTSGPYVDLSQNPGLNTLNNVARSQGMQDVYSGIGAVVNAVKQIYAWGQIKSGVGQQNSSAGDSQQQQTGSQQSQSYEGGGRVAGIADGGSVPGYEGGGSGPASPNRALPFDTDPAEFAVQAARERQSSRAPALLYHSGGRVNAYDDGGGVGSDDDATPAPADQPAQPQNDNVPNQPRVSQAPAQVPSSGAQDRTGGNVDQYGLPVVNEQDPVRGAAQKIMRYLTGADAAPPQTVQAIENAVAPGTAAQGGQAKDQTSTTLQAIHYAAQKGGPGVGYGVSQAYRKEADAARTFAATAANQGNLPSAADAATKAMAYTPDGTRTTFTPSQNGVTATVTSLDGSNKTIQVPMNVQKFQDFLKAKNGGYDSLMMRGSANVLGGYQTGGQQTNQQAGAPSANQTQPGQAPKSATTPQSQQAANTRDTSNDFLSQDLETRSRRLFPWASQNQQRLNWLENQEQQNTANKINMTRAGHDWATQNAVTRANAMRDVGAAHDNTNVLRTMLNTQGRADVSAAKNAAQLQQLLTRLSSQHQDQATKNAINYAQTIIRTAGNSGQSPEAAAAAAGKVLNEAGVDLNSLLQQSGVQQQEAPAGQSTLQQPGIPARGQGSTGQLAGGARNPVPQKSNIQTPTEGQTYTANNGQKFMFRNGKYYPAQ